MTILPKVCERCGKAFTVALSEKKQRFCCKECVRPPKVPIVCQVCGETFLVHPTRLRYKSPTMQPKYCRKECAWVGQKEKRTVWNKGLTKQTSEKVAAIAKSLSQYNAEHPGRFSGERHPFFGKTHTPEARAIFSEKAKKQPITPGMLRGLEAGRRWCKGKTVATSEALARRNKAGGNTQRGRRNPEHGEKMRKFWQEHPELHPNHRQKVKGHETNIERSMRLALTAANIPHERQFNVLSFWADFAFPEHRLIAEVDGEYWHKPERDADRDARLLEAGWHTMRFSEKRVLSDVAGCVAEIAARLAGDKPAIPWPLQGTLPLDL